MISQLQAETCVQSKAVQGSEDPGTLLHLSVQPRTQYPCPTALSTILLCWVALSATWEQRERTPPGHELHLQVGQNAPGATIADRPAEIPRWVCSLLEASSYLAIISPRLHGRRSCDPEETIQGRVANHACLA